ncbi:Gfo/Idh/MocA family protein [Oleiharenicola lentus]|uniref:Gfo/Idh/MocA family protein n=1 Tax=Oleiharenicola lentus TaxID=2508720 RepID=UPI003F679A63
MSSHPVLPRRAFLKTAALGSFAALAFPAILRSQSGSGWAGSTPNNRLNIAFIGVGGRGKNAVLESETENLVAFCDVDDVRAAATFKQFPNVPRFRDYRQMLDKLGNQIDAVRISTPDHMHYPMAVAALSLGKHVYVEKPLTHTVWESRQLAKLAREKKVATQMGNQGHANEGVRLLTEWFDAGVLGEVREIHTWTNRPTWVQGLDEPDHSKVKPAVPATLDWDLWLGVAPQRAYDPAFAPFKWRGYWDYGCGALGDMGCHLMDGAYTALRLGAPDWVESGGGKQTAIGAPTASIVTYHFPTRGALPAVKWTWYDGGLMPVVPENLELNRALPLNGSLIVGSKATVLSDTYYGSVRIVPETLMRELAPTLPPKTLPRAKDGHIKEWFTACKGGPAAGSNFDYAAPFSEVVLLGNVAIRARRRIEWDSAALKITNVPAANQYLTKEYRPGFGV